MTHDFARQRAARNSRERKGSSPPWMWFASGLVIGVLLSFLVYLATFAPDPARPAVATTTTTPSPTPEPTQKSPQHKPEFSFYSDLPKITVDRSAREEPAPAEKPAAAPPAHTENAAEQQGAGTEPPVPAPIKAPPVKNAVEVPEPVALTLQAGAFRDAADANRRRADITLLGYPSRVETVTGASAGARYRVQVGPFADAAALAGAKGALKDQNIEVR